MKNEFIPYEQALALKELGFDEICPTKYGMTSLKLYDNWKPYKNSDDLYNDSELFCNDLCSAPLYQQAFRWFREKYGLDNAVLKDKYVIETQEDLPIWYYGFNTYEEAELECLKKLIEITKKHKL